MPRPKIAEEQQLKHLLRIRVDPTVYLQLTTLQKQSDCRSICEISRKILSGGRINLFQKDASMNGPMEELALIRKEIKAIGININQQTHYFHTSQSPAEPYQEIKVLAQAGRAEVTELKNKESK